jgi:hypothetical protein
MYYVIGQNVNSREYGVGNRRLLKDIRVNSELPSNVLNIVESIKKDLRNDRTAKDNDNTISGVTLTGKIFEDAESFLPLINALKKARINIWVYTSMRLDHILMEIRNGNQPLWLDLLRCIPVIVDGYNGLGNDEYYKRDKGLKFRFKNSERIIDVKKTINKQDGRIYLLSYAHLQEPIQNRYNFYYWMKNKMYWGDEKAIECIKYITRFDPDMVISNDIEEMVNHLKSLGSGRKDTNKFKYIHNRWCTRTEMFVEETHNSSAYNEFKLHFTDRENEHYMTANELLLEYRKLKKEKKLPNKKKFSKNTKHINPKNQGKAKTNYNKGNDRSRNNFRNTNDNSSQRRFK